MAKDCEHKWKTQQSLFHPCPYCIQAERDALAMKALGFAHAWCCRKLDLGFDPRKVHVLGLIEDWERVALDAAKVKQDAD